MNVDRVEGGVVELLELPSGAGDRAAAALGEGVVLGESAVVEDREGGAAA